MVERSTRYLRWDACYNARELGGYQTENHGELGWRTLLRADNLSRLTPEGQAALIAYGVGTIIDLRSEDELVSLPYPLMQQDSNSGPPTYLNLPLINEEDGVWQAAVKGWMSNQEFFCLMLDRFKGRIATIIKAVAGAAPGSVLVHCHAGKDRTGIVIALLLALAGVPRNTIVADYALSEEYFQPLLKELLAEVPDDPAAQERLTREHSTPPEAMMGMLSYLDTQYGGAEEYLLAAGVTRQEMERIRRSLLA